MGTKSTTRLLMSIHHSLVITRKHYLTCATVCVNISMCILILVHSLCTREHHDSYLWNVLKHTEEHKCFCKLRYELYHSHLYNHRTLFSIDIQGSQCPFIKWIVNTEVPLSSLNSIHNVFCYYVTLFVTWFMKRGLIHAIINMILKHSIQYMWLSQWNWPSSHLPVFREIPF